MHDRFAARCKAAAAANLAYIIRYILPLYTHPHTHIKQNGLSNEAANDSLRCRHACPFPPTFFHVLFTACLGSKSHSGLLATPRNLFPALRQLTAHCAVTQIAWKSIIFEIEIDVFLTVRQKCFEACLILLSTLSSASCLCPRGALKTGERLKRAMLTFWNNFAALGYISVIALIEHAHIKSEL